MNRHRAKNANAEAREQAAPTGIRIVPSAEFMSKLTTSDARLTDDEIAMIGEYIVAAAGHNHQKQTLL
jgi:hypothetical protein